LLLVSSLAYTPSLGTCRVEGRLLEQLASLTSLDGCLSMFFL
jgi:hypothetical protein